MQLKTNHGKIPALFEVNGKFLCSQQSEFFPVVNWFLIPRSKKAVL